MNCIACGALLPEGATTCPQCGQPVQPAGGYQQPVQPMGGYQQPVQPMGGYQQPVQPMGGYQQPVQPTDGYQQQGQPMGGYQQPVQPMGGYQQQGQPMGGYQQPAGGGFNSGALVNTLKTDWMKLASVIGGLFIFLAPLFHWISAVIKYDGEKEKGYANLFGLAGDEFNLSGVLVFFAIVMMIAGAVLILSEISDFIPAVSNIKAKIPYVQYIEIGIVVLVLIFWFLAFFNGDLHSTIEDAKASMEFLKSWGEGVKGHVNHGFGPILSMIGIVLSLGVRGLRLANINIGKKN